MSELSEVIGRPTGAVKVVVERGPVAKFADAVKNDSPVYQSLEAARAAGFEHIPAPPTYAFSALQYWGRFPEDQPPDPTGGTNPMMEVIGTLMAKGGMVLHGEQEFEYHKPIQVGDVLTSEGKVVDCYSKESKGRTMTFLVVEDVYRDEAGEPVLTSRMNLIHRS
ncbi:MaoC family dehydratase N-terminal domain-containing protein [Rhabdothermincola sp.]|uniref:MaoC family dehydratase N-terminal domain-containing protein n=1 Tax=Rhabdothermincola sp. TaxID=2820405 RepID=UPI002FE19F3E